MTLWDYKAYGDGVLERAAEEADTQSKNLKPVKCIVREESKNRTGILTEEDANAYNKKMYEYCKGLGNFIKKKLIEGKLKADVDGLQEHERKLHVMCFRLNDKTVELAWQAKLSQMFIDQYIIVDQQGGSKGGGLKKILHLISITNPILPGDHEALVLTGSQAYGQQLEISHTHHLRGDDRIYDCNPNNFNLENHSTNMAKRACSQFFWMRECQCDKPCHHRCVLLDENRYEYEVQAQLVMCVGFWPDCDEAGIRRNIRDKFIAHHNTYQQSLPQYLFEDNQEQLLKPQYPNIEGMRDRFDMNAPGGGIYCPRQQRYVKFEDVLNGECNIPVGLIQFLEERLRKLRPVKAKVQAIVDDAVQDRSVPGNCMSQDAVDKENLFQFQRVLAMCSTLKMIAIGKFIKNHPDMSMEEREVSAVLYDGMLGDDVQVVSFAITKGGLRNEYCEQESSKEAFGVSLPRLLKTLQIYFDNTDKWLKMGAAAYSAKKSHNEWLEEDLSSTIVDTDEGGGEGGGEEVKDSDRSGDDCEVSSNGGSKEGEKGEGSGDGNDNTATSDSASVNGADENGEERKQYADPQVYLNHTSIRSPKGGFLTPQQASAQVLNASHTTHPKHFRYKTPLEVQPGGAARDANPKNTICEEQPLSLHRSVCSLTPSIPSMGNCTCHPTYRCKPALYKFDEQSVNDAVVVQSQLGPHGRYPDADGDIMKVHKKVLEEVKAAFKSQGEPVPKFVNAHEQYGPFLIYKCKRCDTEYHTCKEAEYCCIEQVSNQEDNRPLLKNKQINDDPNKHEEVLKLVLKWGFCNQSLIASETSFKFKEDLGPNKLLNGVKFQRFCARTKTPFEVLKECSGNKFGCPCQLHDDMIPTSM